ncbi:hypothetical protein A5791_18520 [Mycobacterium sp. 852002-51163_SCH5372311]|uniref:WXG100 family type VII secretion target n=1 Tax=Mycobacterium sp. 852002-51163_SCH5372311 TaxID=1834097 RepID=UPI0007FD6546|nr:WXG100 family type VII secretion target [Mycobacterium sp. 852002-51163_SCH5372311]OBF87924.1 hypothetical protein A5791_18520 [Mycobacterium sp. 852002-51163_SCH5372311]
MGTSGGTAFHVDLVALNSAAELFDSFEKSAEQFLADVERKVKSLHIDWQGETAAAHLEAQRRWTAGAQEMHTAVGQLRAILTAAHSNYGSAAAANTAMWRRS